MYSLIYITVEQMKLELTLNPETASELWGDISFLHSFSALESSAPRGDLFCTDTKSNFMGIWMAPLVGRLSAFGLGSDHGVLG